MGCRRDVDERLDCRRGFRFLWLLRPGRKPPEVSRASIPYALTVEVAGDPSGLKDAVRDASSLYSLRKDAPPDGEALARRAQGGFAPVIHALWGAGYYNAGVTIAIDRAGLAIDRATSPPSRAPPRPIAIARPPRSSSRSNPAPCLRSARCALSTRSASNSRKPSCRSAFSASSRATRRRRANGPPRPASSIISASKGARSQKSSPSRRSSITRKTSWT